MKKIEKIMIAVGMISMLLSFTGCDLLTEAELKGRNANNPTIPGVNNGNPGNSGTSDTIGDSWGALFSDRTHNPIDLQVWQGFDASYDSENGMKCVVIPGAWFGGAIVQDNAASPKDCIYYDMSKVSKVTFKVKASNNMTIWAGYSNQNKNDSLVKQNINVTTSWQTITLTQKGVSNAWAIFAFGSDGVSSEEWLAFKDVTYFDSENESLSLKYVQ
ncbi:hypothetical protein SAMN04487977_102234 [Treponema bryantii]|jgi:hypothetical protein|uniref:Uncharacterized protein n=1 Tax=Treponema bryantii TaxID=163 RepID=A0A1H9CMU9_9SPIR|nr:hypothetical protein [Treponema bryantii]BDC92370.1 hypothetical protein TRBR_04670 [Treponema bryantii]SEQ02377.1 hypothetical protein SAMN04487977_102234 [Treponema bryantii]